MRAMGHETPNHLLSASVRGVGVVRCLIWLSVQQVPDASVGGEIVIDVYERWLFPPKPTYLVWPVTRRMSTEPLYRMLNATISAAFDLEKGIQAIPGVGRMLARLIPIGPLSHAGTGLHYTEAQLKRVKAFEMLSPRYDIPQRIEDFRDGSRRPASPRSRQNLPITVSTLRAEEQPPERAKRAKLSIVALVGRRDEPTDALRDYCAWLGEALKQRDVEFETVEVRWDQQGWLMALANLWWQSAAWHGRWVLLQYTALMWSRRGFPLAVPMILWMARKRGCWTAAVLHDVYAVPGRRWIDRVRVGFQVRIMRHFCGRVDRAIFPVPVEQVPWLSSAAANSVFIPVGANLPSLDELRQAGVVPKRTLRPKVAVFGVSEWPAAQKQEVDHIAQAMRQASEALGELNLYVAGRGAKSAEEALRRALAGSQVHLTVDGVLDSQEISTRISECEVLLFVRGPLSSRRGSGLAGLACGLPIVAYEGRETSRVLRDAGILFIPQDDVAALAERLIALLRDPALRSTLASRSVAVFRRWFSWEHIAQRFVEVLGG